MRTLAGHGGGVRCVAFSPDGATLASGGDASNVDNTTKLWRVSDGRNLLAIPGISWGVAFSPDGTTLATAQGDVSLWSTGTGELLRTFNTNRAGLTSVAFTPDGQSLLAAGHYDSNVRLWRIADGSLIRTFADNNNGVWSLSLAPDGNSFLAGGYDFIRLWRLADGVLVRMMDQETPLVTAIAFAPDCQSFAYGRYDNAVAVARVPLWITGIERTDGRDVIRWQGGGGRFQVQTSANLASGSWRDVGDPTAAHSATNASSGTQTFYRVRNSDE